MIEWILKGILLAAALGVLVLTYRSQWILTKLLHIAAPTQKQLLFVKLFALGLGILLFFIAILCF